MSLFQHIDWGTVILYLIVVTIGFVAVFSATFVEDSEAPFSFSHFYIKHLFWIGVSWFVALVILLLDRSSWHKWAYIICGVTVAIVLLTFTPLGHVSNGARAWLRFGSFTLQPMELAKAGVALAVARIMSNYGFSVQRAGDVFKVLVLLFIPISIAVLQNDTGSGLVFCSFLFMFYREGLDNWICVPMIFLAALLILSFLLTPAVLLIALICIFTLSAGMIMRDRWKVCVKYLFGLLFISTAISLVFSFIAPDLFSFYNCLLLTTVISMVGVVVYAYRANIRKLYMLVFIFFMSVICLPTSNMVFHLLRPYQQDRIRTFLGLHNNRDLLYNVTQSKIAIGSGGFSGQGFLEGVMVRYARVPERHTDFIFCTIAEEFGFIGVLVLFSFMAMLILRIMRMGDRQLEGFGRVYCYCVASILVFHCFINIGMTMGLVPVMGIPLPLISYGGSSMLGFTILIFIAIALDASPTKHKSNLSKW